MRSGKRARSVVNVLLECQKVKKGNNLWMIGYNLLDYISG